MSELIGYLSEVEQLNGELTIPKQLGGSTLGSKTITANGVYDATDDGVDGYDVVTANVPNTYAAGDEGKVVDNGALVSQTTATYTVNNTYDTTKIKSVTVNVGGGSPTLETITKTYTPSASQQTDTITPGTGYDGIAEVDVTVDAMPTGTLGTPVAVKGTVSNHSVDVTPVVATQAGYIATQSKTGTAVTVSASELDSGTKSITANGTNQDVVGYAAVDVAVPNSYSAGDEGKVVSNGALVSQTSDTVTVNDTYDTTLINSLTVNVSGGGGDEPLIPAAYQRVEYIEGSGSGAVIDTGFIPTKYTSAILKFTPLVVTGDSLFGTMGVLSGDRDKWRVFNYSSRFYFDCGGGDQGRRMDIASWLPVNTQKYVSIGNRWIIDMTTGGAKTGSSAVDQIATVTTHIFINGGAQDKSANAIWYVVKIFDNGDLVRDFVPCYRIADDVVGLYDRVTEAFFTNVGSGGSFVAGPDVVSANDLILILLGESE